MRTFKVSNFRLFGSEGTRIKFKPVTILTGTNSSGKSSFVKALLLFRNYLNEVRKDHAKNPASVQLDFTDQSLKLSGFEDVLNYSCKKGDAIRFGIESTSKYAPYDFDVEFAFVPSPYSRNKGELKNIMLSYKGELLCKANAKDGRISYFFPDLKGKLLEAFLIYLKGKTFQSGTQEWSRDDNANMDKLLSVKSKHGYDVTEWKTYAFEDFHSANISGMDQYDMTRAIRKYEETGVLFFFPLLEAIGELPKLEAVEMLKNATAHEAFNGFLDDNGKDLKEMVISEFISSKEESFIDFYRSKENEALMSFVKNDPTEGTLYYSNYLSDILRGLFIEFTAHNFEEDGKSTIMTFGKICRFMHIWQASLTPESDSYIHRDNQYLSPQDDFVAFDSYCLLPNMYDAFLSALLSEILTPGSLENLKHVGNSFTPVQRLYSYDDRSGFVDSIKQFKKYSRLYEQNKGKEKAKNKNNPQKRKLALYEFNLNGTIKYKPGTFINKWLKELGIASRLIIEDEVDGLGFKLFLEDKRNGRLAPLADQGHGITQLVSILLQIECEILRSKLLEAQGLDAYEKDMMPNFGATILAIEEPEVSLHPSMQSKLAILFEDAARNHVRLIVETHSEYMVRRTQAYVAGLKSDEEFNKNPFIVYYFNNDGTSYDLEYMKSGRFAKSFGSGFFDEASKSSIEILRREKEDRG